MPLLAWAWSWVMGHSAKQLMYAGAFLAIGLFAAYEIDHQRNIGYDECKAADLKASEAAQTKADKAAVTANQQVHDDVSKILAPLPDYLTVYNAPAALDADCKPVPYVRKAKGKTP